MCRKKTTNYHLGNSRESQFEEELPSANLIVIIKELVSVVFWFCRTCFWQVISSTQQPLWTKRGWTIPIRKQRSSRFSKLKGSLTVAGISWPSTLPLCMTGGTSLLKYSCISSSGMSWDSSSGKQFILSDKPLSMIEYCKEEKKDTCNITVHAVHRHKLLVCQKAWDTTAEVVTVHFITMDRVLLSK